MLAFVPRACAHVLVLILIDMSVFMLVGWVCVMCVIGMLQVVDWLEISFRVGFTMTRLLGRAICCPSLKGRKIGFRLGFTMTRLLGRETCCLTLTGRKSVFVYVSQ